MARLLTLILLSTLLFSCATRKVAKNKSVTEIKTESVVVEKKDSVSVQQNAITIKESISEIEITPIDTAKPLIIEGKEYFNATVRLKKTNRQVVDSTKVEIVKSEQKSIEIKKEENEKSFEKEVEKKSSTFFWIWLLLIAAVVVAVIRYILK